jgi:tetratricopeptide (TPR) repeat protein
MVTDLRQCLHYLFFSNYQHHMKALYRISLLVLISTLQTAAQISPLTAEPDGGNKKAFVAEQIGIVKIEISYSRPGVNGREGKIWNTPVAHYGFVDLGHGTSYAAPWRAGANENTTISFSHPVKIEGRDLPAGKYGFFIALGEQESTLIFNKINSSWGSFYYDEKEDQLRVPVKNQALEKSVEWLKYEFTDQTPSSAVIAMSWEKRMIPFKVEAETQKLQIAAFKSDLRTTRPYYDFIQAANYCLANNIELEQALAWMDRAIYFRVMGEKNFRTLSTKAAILTKMGRNDEAKKVMDEAVPMGSMTDVHYYGRTLLNGKQNQEAFKVFKANYDKYPAEFTTNVGMGRAYSAMGDYKKALTYLKAALPNAPNEFNKNSVATMIQKLEEGKDVNQ